MKALQVEGCIFSGIACVQRANAGYYFFWQQQALCFGENFQQFGTTQYNCGQKQNNRIQLMLTLAKKAESVKNQTNTLRLHDYPNTQSLLICPGSSSKRSTVELKLDL